MLTLDPANIVSLESKKNVSFFKTSKTSKVEKLQLVHTNVWGLALMKSLRGSQYYVTFINDSKRKLWIYFLTNKYDLFFVFKRWKKEVDTERGLKVKCFKSDNGGEYGSSPFKEFCLENGIRMIKIVPRAPEKISVAERMNRTLDEIVRCMTIQSGLPKVFWANAINTTTYP